MTRGLHRMKRPFVELAREFGAAWAAGRDSIDFGRLDRTAQDHRDEIARLKRRVEALEQAQAEKGSPRS
jgi:hypothetical protein